MDQIKSIVDQGGKPLDDLVEGLINNGSIKFVLAWMGEEFGCPYHEGFGCARTEVNPDTCGYENDKEGIARCWLRAMLGVKREK